MVAARRRILLSIFKLFDLWLLVFSLVAATLPILHEDGVLSLTQFLSMRVKVGNIVLFAALLLVWHIIFVFSGLYHSRRLSTHGAELLDILMATSGATLVLSLATLLFHIRMITPHFVAVFWAVSSVTVMLSRLALRYLLERIRIRGRNLRYVVIAGTNRRAIEFARHLEANLGLGYRITGFVDVEWAGTPEFRKSGYPVVCAFNGFSAFLRSHVVDEVIIILPIRSRYSEASRIVALSEEQGILTRCFSSPFNLKSRRSKTEDFADDALVTLTAGAPQGGAVVVKRLLDITISLICIVIFAPIFLITALLIKLTSRGPAFFVQERLGLNKRLISVYKFRTMVQGAEREQAELERLNEASGPVFKIKNDPRITPIGKFLRKTSIDELPQLFNVLKGDMSLVGPRPLPVRDYQGFDQDWQRRRFSIRPGITCLWQINGRSSIPFEKWMELDMQYLDKWSLWLDLQILIRTIPAVLKGSGAA